ncbi:hypothetical protein OH807_40900 [Kitasatospora sp. NBC_01560]|uniref:hypothetical protein n=1 Tax=Kitasatospora sp. NBC_01560 TaxID=2975965 RepID=UPI00386A2A77
MTSTSALGDLHELVSPRTVALHRTCDGNDSAPVLGEGRDNRYVPFAENSTSIGPVPPCMKHYSRLIGD